jgi:predicted RNase H-like HicB family nuclease
MTYEISLHPTQDGRILADCPALPGCQAIGRNENEALANIKEAITAWTWDVRQLPDMRLPLVG